MMEHAVRPARAGPTWNAVEAVVGVAMVALALVTVTGFVWWMYGNLLGGAAALVAAVMGRSRHAVYGAAVSLGIFGGVNLVVFVGAVASGGASPFILIHLLVAGVQGWLVAAAHQGRA